MKRLKLQPGKFNIGAEAHRLGSLEAGEAERLEKALLLILSFHVGRDKAIVGSRMLFELNAQGFDMRDTRLFRETINNLRKQGWPIGSTGGVRGGYWMCQSWAELESFLKIQFHDFAMDLLEQEKAMRNGATRFWGQQMTIY